MRDFLRDNLRWLAGFTAAGAGLRLYFIVYLSAVTDDGFLYGDIAKNWLTHGVYGIGAVPYSTLIRLPGYPGILAGLWSVFGVDNYGAVFTLQFAADLLTCFVIADLTRRTVSVRAARVAFAMAALCPFVARYCAMALTETLAILFAALALDFAVAALNRVDDGRPGLAVWAGCGAAIGMSILLRPDGGILLAVTGIYLAWRWWRDRSRRRALFFGAVVMAAVAVVPLVPWAVRNYQTFGVFQPIAPRYANDPGEFTPAGFNRWVKTWMADYTSVENFYWNEGDAPMKVTDLPWRAFDSPEEYVRVKDLLDEYNLAAGMRVTPELDMKFAALAQERVERHPLRYYAWLPAVRVADMWLRPRTESLGIESTWWDWENDPSDSAKAIGLGLGNLAMILAALAGIALSLRAGGKTGEGWGAADGLPIRGLGLLLTFVALRSAFLGTLENPETRYTLECFPVVICLGAAGLGQVKIPNCKRWLAGLVLRFQNKSATR